MADILEENLKCLDERLPDIRAGIEEFEPDNTCYQAFCDVSAENEPIVGVVRENRGWYFNSRYQARYAAKLWAEAQGEIHYKSIYVLCGISNGMYLEELLSRMGDENKVVVYEPNPCLFLELLKNRDLTKVLMDKRTLYFVEGINMKSFRLYFSAVFSYELINYSKIVIAPNYGMIYAKELEAFNVMCLKATNAVQGEKNTYVDLGREMVENAIMNLWYMMKASRIDDFLETARKTEIGETPAIIISAGPSLDKNIEDLKQAKGHAFLIATDSAVRKLFAHNIMPDIVISIDSHKPMVLFEDERFRNIPVVLCGQSRCELYAEHNSKIIIFADNTFIYKLYIALGKPLSTIQTGGSVATNAFSLARDMGFTNIIFVGQDLAFTDKKKHASDVYDEKSIEEEDQDVFTYVEGIDGTQLLTYTNFSMYRDWFEAEIKDNPELHVLNATEGGANIKGARNCTLQSAIEELCRGEFRQEWITAVPDAFPDEQLEEIYTYLADMPQRCRKLESTFKEGKRAYQKLKELTVKGKTSGSDFRRVMKTIEEVNHLGEEDFLVELVSMCCKKDEYEVLGDIYEKQEDSGTETLAVADKGIRLLEEYIATTAELRKMFEVLVEYVMAQDVYEMTTYPITS